MEWIDVKDALPSHCEDEIENPIAYEFDNVLIMYELGCETCGHKPAYLHTGIGFYNSEFYDSEGEWHLSQPDVDNPISELETINNHMVVKYWMPIPKLKHKQTDDGDPINKPLEWIGVREDGNLSSRAFIGLQAEGINTVDKLIGRCKRELLYIPNISKKTVQFIIEQLATKGLKLKRDTLKK